MARGGLGGRPPRRPSLYFPAVNAEFNWWLLIVGLVVGAGIAWFVLMDARRRDVDVDDQERPREALWLSRMLTDEGHRVSPDAAERMLVLHRAYLEAPPPDDPEPVAPPASPAADPSVSRGQDRAGWPAASELADDDRVGVEGRASDVGQ
jgi:hypothetical protein